MIYSFFFFFVLSNNNFFSSSLYICFSISPGIVLFTFTQSHGAPLDPRHILPLCFFFCRIIILYYLHNLITLEITSLFAMAIEDKNDE